MIPAADWRRVCAEADVRGGEMRAFQIGPHRLLVVRVGPLLSAFADRCCHKGFPLSRGQLVHGVITCAAHEWQYDARTGAGLNPANVALGRYPIELRDGQIWIDIAGGPDGARGANPNAIEPARLVRVAGGGT